MATDMQRIEIDPLAPPLPRIIEDNSQRRQVVTPRPKGVHTKHLTELDRFRVRTLYYDACLSKGRIRQITGYSPSQIRTAVRAKTAAVGKRPGRPKEPKKRGSQSSNAKSSSPNESDANAELLQQAREYFSREGHMSPGEDDDDDDDGESDDEGDDGAPCDASAQAPTPTLALAPSTTQTSAVVSSLPVSAAGGAPALSAGHRRTTFNDLSPEIRIHIWRCVLSTSPTQVAPSRSWALAVLPHQPWLELGMSPPPHVKLENPPWAHYVDTRHVPATVLTRVNREARKTVLERCTPILVSRTTRESSKGIPLFIWIDRYSDVIHFFGEPFRHELFDMAGRSACPELYR
ncbi:hypothetical protein F5Y09DRAFT_339652 [Xylaria sp. FL1042]|nr:hypothetical protein F5Y09DRAFT_339652 [Xylaria sp. FL1042]